MKRVYIAGPIRQGKLLHNLKQADDAVKALLEAGLAFYNPMWSCYAGGVYQGGYPLLVRAEARADASWPSIKFENWMENDYAWINVCDAVLRLPGESTGADLETKHARERGIPVFYSVQDCINALTIVESDTYMGHLSDMTIGSWCVSAVVFGDPRFSLPIGGKWRSKADGRVYQITDRWEGKAADVPARVTEWAYREENRPYEAFVRFAKRFIVNGQLTLLKSVRIK